MLRPALLALFLLASPAAALAQACPAPLAAARRLVLVTAPDMGSRTASLQRYTRAGPQARWQADGGPVTALIGRSGLGWARAFAAHARDGEPVKIEGDDRTPAGVFRIGRPFGREPARLRGYLRLGAGTLCVDDPRSPAYNTITTRAAVGPGVHGEAMGRVPDYVRGLLVDYPTDARHRAGSCIFIHVWLPGKPGTSGCVALRSPMVTALQDFAQGGAVLAVVPRQALGRFRGCLPP